MQSIDVIAPNLSRRLSGVTATIVRLLPAQQQSINIIGFGMGLPDSIPRLTWRALLRLPRDRWRVWHARRNIEMLLGIVLRHVFRRRLRLLFTSASQRRHTRWTRFLISRMDAVVATSRRSADYLARPARVILHGIDTAAFCPPPDSASRRALRHALSLPDAFLVGCYGRIRHQKGADVFVDAILPLLSRHPRLTAVVMGRATEAHQPYLRDLRRAVARAGAEERVLFMPEAPVDDMHRWYQALDLFVAAQRWEGFGLTPLEAMACGVPVVATTVGAFSELVVDGETGALIPPGDASAMQNAIAAAISDADALRRQSAAARRRAENHFQIATEAGALNALYQELLAD